MLRFVLGRAGSGKTETIRRMLADRAVKGLEGGVLLVPEQYPSRRRRPCSGWLGPSGPGSYRCTASPGCGGRLPKGGRSRREKAQRRGQTDPHGLRGGRLPGPAGGVRPGRPQRPGHRRDAHRRQRDEAVRHRPGGPGRAAARLGDRGLGKKLRELSLLYETYQAMVEASYLDSRDDLTRLAQALEDSDFFAGCTVGVDSFEGFTAQERKVLVQDPAPGGPGGGVPVHRRPGPGRHRAVSLW